MATIPSFSSFAGTPNLGSAFTAGAGIRQRADESILNARLEREKMGNQMAIAEMETATRRQQLAQQAMMQAQELEAQKSALQQKMMMEAQQLEVEKAYQQAQIGLRERDLGLQEKEYGREVSQAADISRARLAMQRDVEELIAAGESPSTALQHAIARHGSGADLPSGAWSDMIAQPGREQMTSGFEMGQMYPVPGQEGWRFGRTGPQSGQYFPPDRSARIPEEVAFDPALVREGSRYFTKPAEKEASKLEKERNDLRSDLRSKEFEIHRQSIIKSQDPKAKLTVGDRTRIQQYQLREREIAELNNRIAALRSSLTNSPSLPRGGTTNRVGRFEIIAE